MIYCALKSWLEASSPLVRSTRVETDLSGKTKTDEIQVEI